MSAIDESQLGIDMEGSMDPSSLPDVSLSMRTMNASTLESQHMDGSHRVSPVRGRTMKEYDQELAELKRENFNLKLRIYYTDKRMESRYGDAKDVCETNITLRLEVHQLKQELTEKQLLVNKAAQGMETLSTNLKESEQLLAAKTAEIERLHSELRVVREECEDRAPLDAIMKEDLEKLKSQVFDSQKTIDELTRNLQTAESKIESLNLELSASDQAKQGCMKENTELTRQLKDRDAQIQTLNTQLSRQSRDIQDRLEDKSIALEKTEKTILDLEASMKNKEQELQNLEDTLNLVTADRKKLEDDLAYAKRVLAAKSANLEKLGKRFKLKNDALESHKEQVEQLSQEVERLKDELRQMEQDKAESMSSLNHELADAEDSNRRIKSRLLEAENASEKLIETLGHKEGQIDTFREELKKAMEALTKSDEAVELLQAQLEREREEFDRKLKEQASALEVTKDKVDPNDSLNDLTKQLSKLHELIADQNIQIIALSREKDERESLRADLKDKEAAIEVMKEHHNREMASLERELHAVWTDVDRKDRQIQTLESEKILMKDQTKVSSTTNSPTHKAWQDKDSLEAHTLFSELLQEMRKLVDLLRREANSLATLQLKSINNKDTVTTESLLSEIASVHQIYQRLEEGVERNNQLYLVLVGAVRTETRQSDSPDSSSCQDGGHNLSGSYHYQTQKRVNTDEQQSPARITVEAVTNSEEPQKLVDRSLQTSLPFTNQFVQTSPSNKADKNNCTSQLNVQENQTLCNQEKEVGLRQSTEHLDPFRNSLCLDHSFDCRRQDRPSSIQPVTNIPISLSQDDNRQTEHLPHNGAVDHLNTTRLSSRSGISFSPQSASNLSQARLENVVSRNRFSVPRQLFDDSVLVNTEGVNQVTESSNPLSVGYRNEVDVCLIGGGDAGIQPDSSKQSAEVDDLEHPQLKILSSGLDEDWSGLHYSPESLTNMTAIELRDLVAQLQLDFVEVSRNNKLLQQQLGLNTSSALNRPGQLSKPQNWSVNKLDNLITHSPPEKLVQNSPTSRLRSSSTECLNTKSLELKLMDSQAQVQELEKKLLSTENTVRHQSQKIKSYLAALKEAGRDTNTLVRSNSETSLAKLQQAPEQRTASMVDLGNYTDAAKTSMDQVDSSLMQNGHETLTSVEKSRSAMATSPNGFHPRHDSVTTLTSSTNLSPTSARKLGTLSEVSSNMSSPQIRHAPMYMSGMNDLNHISGLDSLQTSPTNLDRTTANMSKSVFGDISCTSFLDHTVLSKLLPQHQEFSVLHEEESNTSISMDGNLTGDKFRSRLQILEKVNVTLREEIGIYEALHRKSMGAQTSFNYSQSSASQVSSDEDLLRKHLESIRAIRQRLEKLDLDKDPEALLIFETHIHRRLQTQEQKISSLQQQLIEDQQTHERTLLETQHRLSREKSVVTERLERMVSDLQDRATDLEDRLAKVLKIQKQLESDKADIQEDLVKRERQLLDMENQLFKLELDKESAETKNKGLQGEKEKLRNELEQFYESNSTLKDIVKKQEKALIDKSQETEKAVLEKDSCLKRFRESELELRRLESHCQGLQDENDELQKDAESLKALRDELRDCKVELEKRESLHSELDRYQREVDGLIREKVELEREKHKLRNQKDETQRRLEESENLQMVSRKDKSELREKLEALQKKMKEKCKTEEKLEHLKRKFTDQEEEIINLKLDLKKSARYEQEVKSLKLEIEKVRQSEADARSRLQDADETVLKLKEQKEVLETEKDDKDAKIRKREKQLAHFLRNYNKLEEAYTRLRELFKEKGMVIQSFKKQIKLYEQSLACKTATEKDELMRTLLKELSEVQQLVNRFLSKMEDNQAIPKPVNVVVETVDLNPGATTSTASTCATVAGQDININIGVHDDTPPEDSSLPELESTEQDLGLQSSSNLSALNVPITQLISQRGLASFTNPLSASGSPQKLKYWSDTRPLSISASNIPQTTVDSDISTLFAVLKLEAYEKMRKEASTCLQSLHGVQARLVERLTAFKTKSVIESVEYSTLRETALSCKDMNTCLEELARLVTTAWITELPPLDPRGHFFDPVLVERNENLQREVARLRSRTDVLDHTVKEQQDRLSATHQRQKQWEQSLYKQLYKATDAFEQVKENFGHSFGDVTSYSLPAEKHSPNKSPRKADNTFG